ncbi:DUF262 domain-containing protein [Streptomyces bobili]|uniref:DUF262 domain-containing protein n=1 Tax=Streptomyces bobili TaxID=67280 RepID=UPI0022528556|nr:DUF262 domain-containing protein [Streptomyces bobili]MCX5522211.1 DUF262 domain-containing protein [Streptomyces bobili]
MTRQTVAPFDHVSLSPSYQSARWLARRIVEGEIDANPPYQRGSVWTEDQRIALVQTWLRGLPSGVVILADRCTRTWAAANGNADPSETGKGMWALVDGKQRLTTAVMWFGSEFAIPASWFPADHVDATEDTEDGPYVRQSGLTPKGQRFMERYCSLLVAETKDCATEADEAAFYLLVNGGGTPQADADMTNAARIARA